MVEKYNKILRDQPLKGVDKVVWWIEYIIRHKGAEHLRSSAVNMNFYEYLMLDVIAYLLAVVLVTLYLMYKLYGFTTCILKVKLKTEYNHLISFFVILNFIKNKAIFILIVKCKIKKG